MTDFFKRPAGGLLSSRIRHEADRIAEQVLINKRSREHGGKGAR